MTTQTCTFCKNQGDLHEVDAPAIRLCSACREKLGTHIAVVCTGCDVIYWLPKTADNVIRASQMSDLPPMNIMENYVVHQIATCKRCPQIPQGYPVAGKWLN